MENILRIGVTLEGIHTDLWVYNLLERIKSDKIGKLQWVLIFPEKKDTSRNTLRNLIDGIFIKILNYTEKKLYKLKNDAKSRSGINIERLGELYPSLQFFYFTNFIPGSAEHELLKSVRTDMVLVLPGNYSLPANTFKPIFGFWKVQPVKMSGNNFLPGFYEVANHKDIIVSTIYAEFPFSKGKYFRDTVTAVNPTAYSYTINNHLWKLASDIVNALQFLKENKEKITETGYFSSGGQSVNKTCPENSSVSFYVMKYYFRKFRSLLKKLFYFDQWVLFYSDKPWNETIKDIRNLHRILPKKDVRWADPFIIEHNEKKYVFFELYETKNQKGHISVFEYGKDGVYSKPRTVLEENYHLSYPYVFEHNGKFYMMPESAADKSLILYESESFPDKWKPASKIFNGVEAHDSSIIYYHDKFWLFTCIKGLNVKWNYDDLYLFYTDDLYNGKWVPHPLNPVVSDPRFARGGGKLFVWKDNLYRVTQNCSCCYGYGVEIFRISNITENEFEQKRENSITPWKKSITGVHTFNHINNLVFMDARISRFRWGVSEIIGKEPRCEIYFRHCD